MSASQVITTPGGVATLGGILDILKGISPIPLPEEEEFEEEDFEEEEFEEEIAEEEAILASPLQRLIGPLAASVVSPLIASAVASLAPGLPALPTIAGGFVKATPLLAPTLGKGLIAAPAAPGGVVGGGILAALAPLALLAGVTGLFTGGPGGRSPVTAVGQAEVARRIREAREPLIEERAALAERLVGGIER